jgi:6-phosphofructokinase
VTSARCLIPEAPYDLDRLADILTADREANPSRYAVVVTAEGAIWKGAHVSDVGEADAFGHRHKANVGEALAVELKRRTGIEAVASELTYDLRSGEPDALDAMVATTYANVAMDLLREGITGRWSRSRTANTPTRSCPTRGTPARRVDGSADMLQRGAVPAALRGPARDPMLLVAVGGGRRRPLARQARAPPDHTRRARTCRPPRGRARRGQSRNRRPAR